MLAKFRLRLVEGEILLDALLEHGIALDQDCGGTLACGACRVVVREGFESLAPASEDEQDMLERAGAAPGARLACQATGRGRDLVIELPHTEIRRIMAGPSALPIALTERAAKHLAVQLANRGGMAVRLAVQPAGCSGLRYSVEHAESIAGDDVCFESHGIRIAVDANSLRYLQGTTLDLMQEGLARRLRFDNPNARESCGCGASFAVDVQRVR
jgi:iron-sulfur cluster assembly protein